jgi:hypothetical protein
MKMISDISELPRSPALYAMYGGQGRNLHVAYIGVAGRLRSRVHQHIVRRDSSVATGTSAAGLNPDYVTEIRWWEHADFSKRVYLEAAELVAFDIYEPTLRSRGSISEKAKLLYEDEKFYSVMQDLFKDEPTGHLIIPNLELAFQRISKLEARVEKLEGIIKKGM